MKLRLEGGDGRDRGGSAPLSALVRAQLSGDVSPGLHAQTRTRLLAELAAADASPARDLRRLSWRVAPPRFAWPLLAAAALALAFASGFLFGSRERAPLIAGPERASALAVRPGASLAPARSTASSSPSSPSSEAAQPRPARQQGTSGPSLRELLERGEAGLVLERVESQGVDTCLRSCSASDLEALADAARYRGRGDLAERALTAQRQRFPGTELASTAAFLLGRAAQGRGDTGAAARYYQTYLQESPRGPLSLEALGRSMQLAQRAADHERARALARQVLARGGSGAYAAQAREILSEP